MEISEKTESRLASVVEAIAFATLFFGFLVLAANVLNQTRVVTGTLQPAILAPHPLVKQSDQVIPLTISTCAVPQ